MSARRRSEREAGTRAGNYFVSNYPPYSFWKPAERTAVDEVLGRPSPSATPLGIYVHVPFCRQRCDFCYFKVYTDKSSKDIRRYLAAVLSELESFARRPYLAGRRPRFVYFGGGTPSYLSADQMRTLFAGLQEHLPWDEVEEVAFECEPGTLSEPKIRALKELGVTRLSLGVENFDPDVLERNNRAHRAKEIDLTYELARRVGFDQINIDLIAGMVGESDANWRSCIDRTIDLQPDSVTIYQLEVPYNTTLYRRMRESGSEVAPVADWRTKRRWTAEAFECLRAAGYRQGSAYTAVRTDRIRFVYRDALWRGADMLGLGVSSFSHLDGVHFQNEHAFDDYVGRVERGEAPIARALPLTPEERFRREFILQLKLGEVALDYFRDKFGVDPLERFERQLRGFEAEGLLEATPERVRATPDGLLCIDNLLEAFFLEEHRGARYA